MSYLKMKLEPIQRFLIRVDNAIKQIKEELSIYLKPKASSTEKFLEDQLREKVAFAKTQKIEFLDENFGEYNESIEEMERKLQKFLKTKPKPSFDDLRLYTFILRTLFAWLGIVDQSTIIKGFLEAPTNSLQMVV